uniref:WRKY transcription factor 64 n=1 Tax=Gossypium hirsutum TaxID=3635 RepID=A0A068LCN2_GOSHI|nr:WRKY transcription factor 64 [Gossypium hirsutum]
MLSETPKIQAFLSPPTMGCITMMSGISRGLSKLHSQPCIDHRANNVKDAAEAAKSICPTKEYGDVFQASIQDEGAHPDLAPDDGFCWRKYGQKDILGAKYPRRYYRCANGPSQGCFAKKRVKRSSDDPDIFEITYCGKHTCNLASNVMPPTAPSEYQEQGTRIEPQQQHNQLTEENQKQQSQDLLVSFQSCLKVIAQDLETPD